ncbi:Mitochondrial substrate carrier family protein C [Bienertia sinuspersici]
MQAPTHFPSLVSSFAIQIQMCFVSVMCVLNLGATVSVVARECWEDGGLRGKDSCGKCGIGEVVWALFNPRLKEDSSTSSGINGGNKVRGGLNREFALCFLDFAINVMVVKRIYNPDNVHPQVHDRGGNEILGTRGVELKTIMLSYFVAGNHD